MKFELNTNRVTEEIADCGNTEAGAIWETLDMQPEELSESEIIMVNGKSDGDKKDGGIPEEVIPRKQITSKELSEIFCNIGSAKDKM